MAKHLNELSVFMENKIPQMLLYLEGKNARREMGFYMDFIQATLTKFLETLEAMPHFSRDWGMSTALMEPTDLILSNGEKARGYILFTKAGPTMYDVGEDRKKYYEQMNLHAMLIETDDHGFLLDIRTLEVSKDVFER